MAVSHISAEPRWNYLVLRYALSDKHPPADPSPTWRPASQVFTDRVRITDLHQVEKRSPHVGGLKFAWEEVQAEGSPPRTAFGSGDDPLTSENLITVLTHRLMAWERLRILSAKLSRRT